MCFNVFLNLNRENVISKINTHIKLYLLRYKYTYKLYLDFFILLPSRGKNNKKKEKVKRSF